MSKDKYILITDEETGVTYEFDASPTVERMLILYDVDHIKSELARIVRRVVSIADICAKSGGFSSKNLSNITNRYFQLTHGLKQMSKEERSFCGTFIVTTFLQHSVHQSGKMYYMFTIERIKQDPAANGTLSILSNDHDLMICYKSPICNNKYVVKDIMHTKSRKFNNVPDSRTLSGTTCFGYFSHGTTTIDSCWDLYHTMIRNFEWEKVAELICEHSICGEIFHTIAYQRMDDDPSKVKKMDMIYPFMKRVAQIMENADTVYENIDIVCICNFISNLPKGLVRIDMFAPDADGNIDVQFFPMVAKIYYRYRYLYKHNKKLIKQMIKKGKLILWY